VRIVGQDERMASDEEEAAYGGSFAFDFFEVVWVEPPPAPHLSGRTATVLGRSRAEDGTEAYALTYEDEPETWMAEGDRIQSTGQRRRREEFYDGTSNRVSPEGEQLGER
jgi:hypothetical protein